MYPSSTMFRLTGRSDREEAQQNKALFANDAEYHKYLVDLDISYLEIIADIGLQLRFHITTPVKKCISTCSSF
jgi:hypothetical protein